MKNHMLGFIVCDVENGREQNGGRKQRERNGGREMAGESGGTKCREKYGGRKCREKTAGENKGRRKNCGMYAWQEKKKPVALGHRDERPVAGAWRDRACLGPTDAGRSARRELSREPTVIAACWRDEGPSRPATATG